MQKLDPDEALDAIIARDPRFEKEAYLFVRDALDFTLKGNKRVRGAPDKHVTGRELLEGVRQFALEQFGPMVPTVFAHWRLRETGDIGHLVFNLIEARVFGKTDRDSLEDFRGGYDFHEAFVRPFLPPSRQDDPPAAGSPVQPAERAAV